MGIDPNRTFRGQLLSDSIDAYQSLENGLILPDPRLEEIIQLYIKKELIFLIATLGLMGHRNGRFFRIF